MLNHIKKMVTWTFMGTGGLLPILLFGAALAVSTAPAGAQVITSTWIGGNPGDWNVAANWSPTGVPNNGSPGLGSRYDVIVDGPNEGPYIGGVFPPSSVTVNSLTIDQGSGFVEIRTGGTLELANSGGLNSQGTVAVKAGGSFILNGGSITSREIKLEGTTGTATRAKLRLNSNTTLSAPTGAEIVGSDLDDTSGLPTGSPQTPDGLIDGDGKLTLGSVGTIRGELEIQVDLVNNGLVDADEAEGKIYLTSTSKSGGSGANFKATAGLLEVDVRVNGSADWTSSGTGYLLITSGGKISGRHMNILKVGGNSGGLKVQGQVTLAGNLDATGTVNSRWLWSAPCKFTGGVAPAAYVTIELAGLDVFCNPGDPDPCNCPEGQETPDCLAAGVDCWDFAWPLNSMGMGIEVIIGPGARVKGVNDTDNQDESWPHGEDDSLFVQELNFEDSAGRYKKDGFHAHFCNSNAEGQIED